MARCVQPGVGLEFLAERLKAFQRQLRSVPAFREAIEALAMLVLKQWTKDQSGLQLHVRRGYEVVSVKGVH